MGRKRQKKKETEGPPPEPMPLTTEREGEQSDWGCLSCRIQIRTTGPCNSCQGRQRSDEHVVTSLNTFYYGYFCDDCCPVCSGRFKEGDLEQNINALRRSWNLFPTAPKEYYPTDEEFALLRAIQRR